MARGKIAPVLTDTVNAMERMGLGYAPMKARRELRALLAVARAAAAYKARRGIDILANGRDVVEGKRLCAALARLDRASGAKGGGR